MALQSDSRGFLVGDPIELGRMPSDISAIRDDVSAIRRAISERGTSFSKAGLTSGRSAASIARDAAGRFTSSQASAPTIATPSGTRKIDSVPAAIAEGARVAVADRIKRMSRSDAALPIRDASGRFAAGTGTGGGASSVGGAVIASISDRLSRLAGAAGGIDEADPAVKAAREIAEPLQRGFEFFRGDKQISWLKKIFSKLSIFHKDESAFSKASTKVLKNIDEKTGTGGGDGNSFSGGAAGSIIGRIVPWALGGLAAAGAGLASTIGGALTTAIAAIFSPIGIAVAAAGVSAWGVFTEDGRKFFSDLGGKMAEGWGKFTDFLVESSPKTMEFLKNAGGKAVAAVNSVKETAGKATSFVTEQAKDVGNYLVESSPKTIEFLKKTGETAKEIGGKAIGGVKDAGNWVLGQTSKLFESGNGGAGAISGGKGDLGGASYGTYQLASKTGTLQQFLKNSKYGENFAGLKPGTPEFNAKWKEVVKNDPEFSTAQHDFIKATHFDPAMRMLGKGGFDLSDKGAAVQDSVWSTSVQFGAGGGSNLIKKALSGKDVGAMSDAEIVGAIQDYKASNNERLFAKSSADVRAGTLNRALLEKEKLIGLASVTASNQSSVSTPKIPVMPPIAQPPQVVEPLSSPVTPQFTVNLPSQDVGQNISDRRIAHIASGGIGL